MQPTFASLPGLRWLIPAIFVMGSVSASLAQGVEASIARGDSLMRVGKPQRAIAEYDKAVNADTGIAPLLARSKAWWALERYDRFVIDVERVLRTDSTNAEAHFLRSRYAANGDDRFKTVYHTTEAINHGTDTAMLAQALMLRGMARAEMKLPAQAIDDLERALAVGITDIDAMTVLARLYDDARRYDDALAILERLCSVDPNNVGHWSNRGFELIQLERYDEALSMIEQALRMDKDEPVALSNRAYVQFKLGNDKEAWQDVERSLRSYPANPFALRTRALLFLRTGEKEKACDDLVLAKAMADLPEVEALINEHCDGYGKQKN